MENTFTPINHKIDWDKVDDLEKIKKILKGMNISVVEYSWNKRYINEIKHLLIKEISEEERISNNWSSGQGFI